MNEPNPISTLTRRQVGEALGEAYRAGYTARDEEVAELKGDVARLLALLDEARRGK